VDFSATGIFHVHRIIVAEGWVVGLGMVRLMEIFPMNRDATLNFEPLTLNPKPRTLNRMDACDASLQDCLFIDDHGQNVSVSNLIRMAMRNFDCVSNRV
jgi:hypothetical protein